MRSTAWQYWTVRGERVVSGGAASVSGLSVSFVGFRTRPVLSARLQKASTSSAVSGALHVHPLVKVERENRALFARLWEQLGFYYRVGIAPVERDW